MSKKPDKAPAPDETPQDEAPQSIIVVEFASPGMAFHQLGFMGIVTPDQIAVAAARLRVVADIMMAKREQALMKQAEQGKIQVASGGVPVPPGMRPL